MKRTIKMALIIGTLLVIALICQPVTAGTPTGSSWGWKDDSTHVSFGANAAQLSPIETYQEMRVSATLYRSTNGGLTWTAVPGSYIENAAFNSGGPVSAYRTGFTVPAGGIYQVRGHYWGIRSGGASYSFTDTYNFS